MPYNAIVIGGGTAGLTAARLLARSGLRVALVEARAGRCVRLQTIEGEHIIIATGSTPFVPLLSAQRALPDERRPARAHAPAQEYDRLGHRSRRSGVCPGVCPAGHAGAGRGDAAAGAAGRRS